MLPATATVKREWSQVSVVSRKGKRHKKKKKQGKSKSWRPATAGTK